MAEAGIYEPMFSITNAGKKTSDGVAYSLTKECIFPCLIVYITFDIWWEGHRFSKIHFLGSFVTLKQIYIKFSIVFLSIIQGPSHSTGNVLQWIKGTVMSLCIVDLSNGFLGKCLLVGTGSIVQYTRGYIIV